MNYTQRNPRESAPGEVPGASSDTATVKSPSQVRSAGRQAVSVYRVVAAERALGAFHREHNLAGGRWSSPGVAAVYAAQSAAGAVLEYLAHMEDERPQALVLVHGHLDADDVAQPGPLPEQWRQSPYRDDVRAFGDRWLSQAQAVALSLPSVLCEASRNLLINPDHPRMGRLELVEVQAFTLDPRLVFPK